MKNNYLFILVSIALVILGYITYSDSFRDTVTVVETTETSTSSPKNATYIINGQSVTLVNGISEVPVAPESASKITTQYFGNDVSYDFDADGRQDSVFLLTQNTGGTGTFYYVVVALNTTHGYVGSHGLLLGDRIAPQTTEMSRETGKEHIVIVNYADRMLGESFDVPPSIGKSLWLLFDPQTMQFGEVVQNFEGEANPLVMKLNMQTWHWVSTTYADKKITTPLNIKMFTLTFASSNKFSMTTDCNGGGGDYAVNGNSLTFTNMMSTLMFCEGSQESVFFRDLGDVEKYSFTSKGELVLNLKRGGGSMIFK